MGFSAGEFHTQNQRASLFGIARKAIFGAVSELWLRMLRSYALPCKAHCQAGFAN